MKRSPLSEHEKMKDLDKQSRADIRRIIECYSIHETDEAERVLGLAELYIKLGEYLPQAFQCIEEAARLQLAAGNRKLALSYYYFICAKFIRSKNSKSDAQIFVNSAMAKISLDGHLMTVQEQIDLLKKACGVAATDDLPESAAKAYLILAQVLKVSGDHSDASRFLKKAWQLCGQFANDKLSKQISLSLSDVLYYTGRVAEVVSHYERLISEVEGLDNDEFTLQYIARVGRCYVMCGQVKRGIELIDKSRSRAEILNFQDTKIYIDIMRIMAFLEIGDLEEADINLTRVQCFSADVLGHRNFWVANSCKAYILVKRGNYEAAAEILQKCIEQPYGFKHQKGPWNFETAYKLMKDYPQFKEWYVFEVKRLLNWDDKYMRGVALRYLAFKDIRDGKDSEKILSNLKGSEVALREIGACIELARTQLLLARYHIDHGKEGIGRTYLQKAWGVFFRVNKWSFPEDLMSYLLPDQRIELIMDRVIDIMDHSSRIQERLPFLDRMIRIIMDVTMATRIGFFVVDSKQDFIIETSRDLDAESLSDECLGRIKTRVMETDQNDNKVVDTAPNFSCSTTEPTYEFMCAPVSLGKKIYGYLYLDNRLNSTSFTSLDSYLTKLVARQIAMGLSNLAIREETGILKERLEDKAAPYEQEPGIVNSSAGVIAVSEIMTRTMAQVKQVAGEYSTVLITGETGVGKGLIAKVIHKASPRRDAPFVHVNLSTIPQELISSELFGHEKGAFTGALERYAGRFERAHGGTIFLDEIGDLPHDIQIKLLGVLQDHYFERLGSGKLITSEFRVIAATNRDLERKIEAGQFREDLYYRLSVFPIHVPPLRERKEDIPHLAHHFLLGLARKMGKKVERISEKGLRNLLLYDWPGNVRELEHYIERAVVSTDKKSRVLWLPDINSFRILGRADSQLLPLAMIEKEHIEKTLHAVRWKVSGPGGAAEILGLNSKTLFSRMKKLGISKTPIRLPHK